MLNLLRSWKEHGLAQAIVRTRLVRPVLCRAYELMYWHDYAWTTTTWLGVPALKYPADAWTYQEIVFETRPELIVETGTNRGGSALFLATICDALGTGRIVSVDVVEHPDRPRHPRISYLTGSSVDPGIVQRLTLEASRADRVMVVLDSDHSEGHVYRELLAFGPLVTPGCYLVCEDTNVNGHPVFRKHGPGPGEALARFLPDHPEFEVDRGRERVGITAHPGGFLRRRER